MACHLTELIALVLLPLPLCSFTWLSCPFIVNRHARGQVGYSVSGPLFPTPIYPTLRPLDCTQARQVTSQIRSWWLVT